MTNVFDYFYLKERLRKIDCKNIALFIAFNMEQKVSNLNWEIDILSIAIDSRLFKIR